MDTEQESRYRHLVESYVGLFNDPASTPEDLKSFIHAEILWREMPNWFAPAGRASGYDEILAAWGRGREFLPQQKYVLRRVIVSDDTAVIEFSWRGVISKSFVGPPAGTELSGQIASFLQFRDGQIIGQTDYPCYEPLP